MKPEKQNLDQFLKSVWDDGIYLSTKVNEVTVTNTYYLDGFFVDLAFNTKEGKITEVFVDDTFCLNANYIAQLNGYLLNYN